VSAHRTSCIQRRDVTELRLHTAALTSCTALWHCGNGHLSSSVTSREIQANPAFFLVRHSSVFFILLARDQVTWNSVAGLAWASAWRNIPQQVPVPTVPQRCAWSKSGRVQCCNTVLAQPRLQTLIKTGYMYQCKRGINLPNLYPLASASRTLLRTCIRLHVSA